VTDALKATDAEAGSLIGGLAAAKLLDAPAGAKVVTVTDQGNQLYTRIRAAVNDIVARMWGDLPAEDLQITGRTLSRILERANAELASLGQ
jgi:hypothetical protein